MVDLACCVGLIAGTFLVAVAYAIRVRLAGAAHHPRIERAGASPLLGKGVMEMGYWAMHAPAHACMALGVTADAISWWSLALAAAAGVSLGLGHYGIGAALSVASFVCDALDGIVARETGTASGAGAVLDAAVDRYAELFFLSGIAVHERTDPVALGLVLGALAGSVMVSYATAKAEALSVEVPRGAMRRQERAVYFVVGTALVPIVAAAAPSLSLPPWADRIPLFGMLGLVAVVGNASAVRRLHAVATSRVHAAASDPLR